MGMAVAAVNSSNCTDTMRGRGYKPVAEAVTTGIILSKEEIPAKIVAVKDNSPADNVGLKSGDIILAIDGKDVTNRIDAGKFLSDGAAGSTLIIKVKRGEQELTMPVGRVPYLSLQAKM
jgi:S1-C subfamily serine protease